MLERTLSKDMTTLFAYVQTWRLKLSHAKTVTTAFHLRNREAKRELKVKVHFSSRVIIKDFKKWYSQLSCLVVSKIGIV